MTDLDDLGPDVPDDLAALALRLDAERPVPRAAFRGALRRRLLREGACVARPARLWSQVAAFAGAGGGLLLAGAASAAGIGPLGA